MTSELVERLLDEELAKVRDAVGKEQFDEERFAQARRLVLEVALADDYAEFLTLPAYQVSADK